MFTSFPMMDSSIFLFTWFCSSKDFNYLSFSPSSWRSKRGLVASLFLNSEPGERVLPFLLSSTVEISLLKDMISAEFFFAASSVFSNKNWE